SGLVTPSGRVRFAGKGITRAAPERVARAGGAHVPEGRGIFRELSVHENLRRGAYLPRGGLGHLPEGRGSFREVSVHGNLRLGAYLHRGGFAEDYERVCGHYPWLDKRRTQQAGTLSGGEQQMLAVARAR